MRGVFTLFAYLRYLCSLIVLSRHCFTPLFWQTSMAINIQQFVFLHQVGKRKNNEDNIFPFLGEVQLATNRLFMVCDGVGGANKGEIASLMVCKGMEQYFAQHPPQNVDAAYLTHALRFVEAQMSQYIAQHPECTGMATTLTLLYLDDAQNKATIAWCGDSRVYQVRRDQILYVTSDHSLVNELIKRGEISAQEAHTHPQRNVILRAISGSESPTKIDVYETTDLQAGDYFWLCTDGILEAINNDDIITTLLGNTEIDLDSCRQLVQEMCEMSSNDNYSLYLLQLGNISPNQTAHTAPLPPVTTRLTQTGEVKTPPKTSYTQAVKHPNNGGGNNKKLVYLLLTVVAALLMALCLYKYTQTQEDAHYQTAFAALQQQYASQPDSLLYHYQQLQQSYPHQEAALAQLIDSLQLIVDENQLRQQLRDTLAQWWNNGDSASIKKNMHYANLDTLQQSILDTISLYQLRSQLDSIGTAATAPTPAASSTPPPATTPPSPNSPTP